MKSKAQLLLEERGEDHFVSEVDVDVFGHPKGIPSDAHLAIQSKLKIKWYLDREERSWGVKSLMPVVPDQEVELLFIESTDEDDIEHKIKWKIQSAKTQWEFTEEPSLSIQINPTSIEIDFGKNESTLTMKVS